MKTIPQEDEDSFNKEEKERTNVVSLKLITGGKEPPDMDCWLGREKEGNCFWVQPLTSNPQIPGVYLCSLFALLKKLGRVYILRQIQGDQVQDVPVDPMRFCRQFIKLDDFVPEKGEEPDEQSNRTAEGDGQRDQAEEVERPKGVPEFL